MKESYRKGIANHPNPESCVRRRKAACEALKGAQKARSYKTSMNASGTSARPTRAGLRTRKSCHAESLVCGKQPAGRRSRSSPHCCTM